MLTVCLQGLKSPPSAAKLARIAHVLDADADGVLSIDVITKVCDACICDVMCCDVI